MRLKIVSDGTPVGTKLIDASTGEAVQYVQNIEWEANVNDPFASATIKIAKAAVEMTSPAKISVMELESPDYELLKLLRVDNDTIKVSCDGLSQNAMIVDGSDKQLSAVQYLYWRVDVGCPTTEILVDRINI